MQPVVEYRRDGSRPSLSAEGQVSDRNRESGDNRSDQGEPPFQVERQFPLHGRNLFDQALFVRLQCNSLDFLLQRQSGRDRREGRVAPMTEAVERMTGN